MLIQITNKCNELCKHCMVSASPDGLDSTMEQVEEVVDQVNEELKKLPVPVKENFVFKGWYTINNDLVSNGDKLDSQNITLYAKWKKK